MKIRRRKRYWWLWHVQASGRFDRSPASYLRALLTYIRLAAIITTTESTRAPRTAMLHRLPGFGVIKGSSFPGSRDPAILYRKNRLIPQLVRIWKLSNLPIPDRGPERIAAVACWFLDRWSRQMILVVSAHLPAHLDDVRQMRVWIDSVKTLGDRVREQQKKHPQGVIIVACDWNVDMRTDKNRARVARLMGVPGLHSSWGSLDDSGYPDGPRLVFVDDSWTNAPVEKVERIKDDDSSDHFPVRFLYRLGLRR